MVEQSLPELPPLPGAPVPTPSGPTKTSGLAIASLVLGVLSCPFSILAGIPGLVCGISGLNQITRSEATRGPERLSGKGMAITGIVLSSLSLLILPMMLLALLLPAVQSAREAARRTVCMNNLRQMALGMLVHESAMGVIPAAITDADGTPLLSWRVAILPYLEEQALYDEFHLDEPWDSPHNRALIPRMPAVFACPSSAIDAGRTSYVLGAGPESAFDPGRVRAGDGAASHILGVRLGDLERGATRSVMIVEAPTQMAVEWTKPDELRGVSEDAATLGPSAGGHAGGIRNAAYADGHVDTVFPDDR